MISYIPVLTTLLSVFFLSRIVPHYLSKRSPYLLWWTLGVLTFGLGTLTESINAIFGWSEWNTKIWYIVGAVLGGYPLAQGTIYLRSGEADRRSNQRGGQHDSPKRKPSVSSGYRMVGGWISSIFHILPALAAIERCGYEQHLLILIPGHVLSKRVEATLGTQRVDFRPFDRWPDSRKLISLIYAAPKV